VTERFVSQRYTRGHILTSPPLNYKILINLQDPNTPKPSKGTFNFYFPTAVPNSQLPAVKSASRELHLKSLGTSDSVKILLCETNGIVFLLNFLSTQKKRERFMHKRRRRREGDKGSEPLSREVNIRKSLGCKNAYAAYTYAFPEQQKATARNVSI